MKKIISKIKDVFYVENSYGQKQINKQMIIIFSAIFLILILTVSSTVAAFLWSTTSEKEQNLIVGNISLNIASSSEPLGSNLDLPVSDTSNLKPYTFTIKNEGSVDTIYKLKIADDEKEIETDECISKQMDKTAIGIKVTGDREIVGTLSDYNNVVLDTGILKSEETKTYNVYLWIKEDAPNEVIGTHFHGKILLESEQTVDGEPIKLVDNILYNNKLITEDENSNNNTSGLKEMFTTNGRIYYFKGNKSDEINNYVAFGYHRNNWQYNAYDDSGTQKTVSIKSGDPILWRVIRTVEDGSIKLILADNIRVNNDNYLSGYVNYGSDMLREGMELWYSNTFEDVAQKDNLIVTTDFCNDRSDEYGAVKQRVDSKKPTLECADPSDIVKAKIGLITADELMYSGDYLDNDTNFWTISPCSTSYPYYMHYNLGLQEGNDSFDSSDYMIRPVISLSPNARVIVDSSSKYKAGSKENPYVVQTN